MIKSKSEFESFVTQNWNEINQYIDNEMQKVVIPATSSIDIRESSIKFAPIDCNLYPAGFNNLCALDLESASSAFAKTIKSLGPKIERVGIIPESNTKNLFYLDHLAVLKKLIIDAGFEVVLLSPDENLFDAQESLHLVSKSHYDVIIEKTKIQDGHFVMKNEEPLDAIILNNDQSQVLNVDWNTLSIPVVPTPHLGWTKRHKSRHFIHYKSVVKNFSEKFGVCPDLIQADFETAEHVDFSKKEGLEELGQKVDLLKSRLPEGTKVFVKASQGTYGMGISVVENGREIVEMNRKNRNKMDIGKNKIKFTSLLLQEGVTTSLKYEDKPAEIAIYLVGGKSVGGFMRVNEEKDENSNLNSRGMVFRKFCISEIRQNQDHKCKEAVYTIIARLSCLASGFEINESKS